MTKVLLVGDTHSDATFVAGIMGAAKKNEVEVVIQLGDFGFSFDRNMIASISAWLDRDESHQFYWIDGNHDQHDFIEEELLSGLPSWDKPVSMGGHKYSRAVFHERMFYVPRGAVFKLGDTTVMGLGGAFSIDKDYRAPHISWWPQELIRQSDMDRAVNNAKEYGRIDVMITHDAPPSDHLETWLDAFDYKVDRASSDNRRALGWVVEQVRPMFLYHGHYHRPYSASYRNTQVRGIGANVNERGYIDHTVRPGYNYTIEEW